MTVAELITELFKFPSDMEVMVQWESTRHDIEPGNLYIATHWRTGPLSKPVLFIDADGNFYKKLATTGEQ